MEIIAKVNKLEITKQDISQAIEVIETDILEGMQSGLEVKIKAAYIKAIYDALNASEVIRNASVIEAEQYHKNERELNGNKFDIAETCVKYDYSKSSAWNYYEAQINMLKAHQKTVETLAKTTKEIIEYPIPETGEMLEIHPAPKYSTTNLKVSIKK